MTQIKNLKITEESTKEAEFKLAAKLEESI